MALLSPLIRSFSLNPHARGADLSSSPTVASDFPQPPRVRGRRQHATHAPGQGASTPACAGADIEQPDKSRIDDPSTPTHVGQTQHGIITPQCVTLNPRARGADGPPGRRTRRSSPQPPRVRGRQTGGRRRRLVLPSTPTHVGQTPAPPSAPALPCLNPHARGADAGRSPACFPVIPQPPRTWGRRILARRC